MNSFEDRLLQVFQAAFPNLPASELKSAQADALEAWDSLATVTLVNLVQEEFRVEIPPEQAVSLVSFEGFRDALKPLLEG